MFRTRRLCLIFLVIFLSIQTNEGICQINYSISKEMAMRCAEAIAGYVKKTRNWDKGDYTITFDGIDEHRNAAAFGVVSYALIKEYERQKDTPGGRILRHHPDDFCVLVDIVDYVVLSENSIDTYFPNAKPGYERAYPYKAPE